MQKGAQMAPRETHWQQGKVTLYLMCCNGETSHLNTTPNWAAEQDRTMYRTQSLHPEGTYAKKHTLQGSVIQVHLSVQLIHQGQISIRVH